MRFYADTSFLLSLYANDANSEQAIELLPRLSGALPLTPLHRLELRNALAQRVFRFNKGVREQAMDPATAAGVWANIEADSHSVLSGGQPLDWIVVVADAEQLSIKHTPLTGTASLDTLHVAAAMSLGTRTFLSFDDRQRELVERVGLEVLPAI